MGILQGLPPPRPYGSNDERLRQRNRLRHRRRDLLRNEPPRGAPLYAEGVTPGSVLFYRFSIAALILGGWLALSRAERFAVSARELAVTAALGVIFALSALSLFVAFRHMDAGIASAILFVYPVMVAVIMAAFFGERITLVTASSIALALGGIALLCKGGEGVALSATGVSLVLVSALLYALYIVVVNRSRVRMSAAKLTFWGFVFCAATIAAYSLADADNAIGLLTTATAWRGAIFLELVSTVISLALMAVAVREIGSTPTAVMGALEPRTAIVIGVTVFGEAFTARIGLGIALILAAAMLIVCGKSLRARLSRIRRRA